MPSKNNLGAVKGVKAEEKTVTPILDPDKKAPANDRKKPVKKITLKRVNKGFQVEEGRAVKWDTLVAQMKHKSGNERKTGPELIDEAMDYLFSRYLNK